MKEQAVRKHSLYDEQVLTILMKMNTPILDTESDCRGCYKDAAYLRGLMLSDESMLSYLKWKYPGKENRFYLDILNWVNNKGIEGNMAKRISFEDKYYKKLEDGNDDTP